MLYIGINGASGRMGQEIVKLIQADGTNYALEFAKSSNCISQQNITYVDHFPLDGAKANVIIDFSTPNACLETLEWCLQNKIPLVVGTTGFNEEQIKIIKAAAGIIPVLFSPNMSLSVNVLFNIAKQVAKYLPAAEVEIIESHHRNKKDAPSGTALRIGEAIADGRSVKFNEVAVFERSRISDKSRDPAEIGFAVIRGGDIVGKHTASFIIDGEELNLTSEITNRKSFAAGALLAAKFLSGKQIGFYSMADALGIA